MVGVDRFHHHHLIDPPDEWQWFFNYIGVFGPKVDKVAEDVTDDVVSQDHRGKK